MSSEVAARARIAHHVPGRLRLQLERSADGHDAAHRLEESMAGMPGVRSVEVRTATRSVVVHYSPAELELERLLAEGLTRATIELIGEGARSAGRVVSRTTVGRHLVNATSVANAGLERATGGILGLRDAFPLTLLGLGLRDVLRGNLGPVPWYNLLYWGYATFADLHGRRDQTVTATPDAREILARRYVSGEIGRDDYREMLAEVASSANGEVPVAPLEREQAQDAEPTKPAAGEPRKPRRQRGRVSG